MLKPKNIGYKVVARGFLYMQVIWYQGHERLLLTRVTPENIKTDVFLSSKIGLPLIKQVRIPEAMSRGH